MAAAICDTPVWPHVIPHEQYACLTYLQQVVSEFAPDSHSLVKLVVYI